MTGLNHDRADEGGGKFQAETEVWPLLRGFQDLTDAWATRRWQADNVRVVPVAALAQQDLLASLSNHAQGWLEHAVKRLQRQGDAVQVKPWERLDGPIFGDGPRDPLNQFLAIGLHPLGRASRSACWWSITSSHYIHRNLFSGFCSVRLS